MRLAVDVQFIAVTFLVKDIERFDKLQDSFFGKYLAHKTELYRTFYLKRTVPEIERTHDPLLHENSFAFSNKRTIKKVILKFREKYELIAERNNLVSHFRAFFHNLGFYSAFGNTVVISAEAAYILKPVRT